MGEEEAGDRMTPSDRTRLTEQLVRQEGLRLRPYTDTRGRLTIGVGRNLSDAGLTEYEATYLLDNDIDRTIRGLAVRYPTWFPQLDPVRQAVLVNMAFNLGLAGVAGFMRMIAAVATGQYGQASDEMMDSAWARQVGARAGELSAQMRTGRWKP
jgi:lysozyme